MIIEVVAEEPRRVRLLMRVNFKELYLTLSDLVNIVLLGHTDNLESLRVHWWQAFVFSSCIRSIFCARSVIVIALENVEMYQFLGRLASTLSEKPLDF